MRVNLGGWVVKGKERSSWTALWEKKPKVKNKAAASMD
jgi:hypothetical protein